MILPSWRILSDTMRLSSSLRRNLCLLPSRSFANKSPVIGLFGVCDDSNSSYLRGPALAPLAIRAALRSESANPYCEAGIDTLGSSDAPTMLDLGDLQQQDCKPDTIRARMRDVLSLGLVPLALGGDHSVSYPLISEVAEYRAAQGCGGFTILHLYHLISDPTDVPLSCVPVLLVCTMHTTQPITQQPSRNTHAMHHLQLCTASGEPLCMAHTDLCA